MKTEKTLKIITCKHSASRTVVEQAADVGPMFKMMKQAVKKMPPTTSASSPLFIRLTDILTKLETRQSSDSNRIVVLPLHKKNAIIVGLSKLPSAMENAFSSSIIKSAFRDNGQLDDVNEVLPSMKNLLGTYCGVIGKDHILNDGNKLIKKYYKEMFMSGAIAESTFDIDNIPQDRDSKGNIITRDFSVSSENRQ